MTDPEQDEAFEAFLKRRSVLPESFDDKLQPPAALDHAVLNEAREAVRIGAAPDTGATATTAVAPAPNKQERLRPPRWAVPVAIAATVLLCLSVVLNVSLNTNRPTPNLERAAVTRADTGEHRESISGDIPSNEVILPEAKVAGSPAPHAPVEAEPAAPVPHAQGEADAAAPATPRADRRRAAAKSATDAAETADADNQASTASPADAASRAQPANPAEAAHPADPKVWLRRIEALRAAGQNEQAAAEMSRFRAAFPDYAAKGAPPQSTGRPPQ